ncbi:MAG: DUF4350 domain-containing protein [Gemmatimonadota bacterium]
MAKPSTAQSWLSPRRLLIGLTALVVIALLFAPTSKSVDVPASLNSYSREPNGARGFYEILDRLGFDVKRWLKPMRQGLDSTATYFLLSPPIQLTTGEVQQLLKTVRGGATLMVQSGAGSRMADSLGVFSVLTYNAIRDSTVAPSIDLDEARGRYVLRKRSGKDSTATYTPPPGARVFETIRTRRGAEPAIVGFALGKGRVLVYADPELFRNSRLREPNRGVRAVRLAEWVLEGNARRTIWFDEYHHGFGTHASLLRATRRALTETPSGRAFLQVSLAGLLLLFAIGVRPIKPQPLARIERRSPLEHVGALARAYEAVKATQLGTRLLVRGLGRRQGALRGRFDEAEFLKAIRDRKPEAADDVERVLRSLNGAPDPEDKLTAAISRIERGLRT